MQMVQVGDPTAKPSARPVRVNQARQHGVPAHDSEIASRRLSATKASFMLWSGINNRLSTQRLKTPYRDGTTQVVFEPVDFLFVTGH